MNRSMICFALAAGACGVNLLAQPATAPTASEMKMPTSLPAGEKNVTPSGLTIITTEKGQGAQNGDTVSVLYTGKLVDGTVFDASAQHGNVPIQLTLGAGRVIKGWEEGLVGMQVGEKRTLVIPSNLAYGEKGRPPAIPPNSTLVFDVQLTAISRQ